ncbi:hypothetical protein OIU77_024066 [Salix suchowensis]|uniref:Uncharacterized protein n=1 Tax=Salix suchowensis TaxID=1278906 RepID=A0ABQ9C9A5_9ROSI|nr:hypothetical protein OIU77_024066 [Salix suchowensis]
MGQTFGINGRPLASILLESKSITRFMLLPLTTPLLTLTDLEDVGLCVFFLEFLLGVYHIDVGNLRNQEGSAVGFYCGTGAHDDHVRSLDSIGKEGPLTKITVIESQ